MLKVGPQVMTDIFPFNEENSLLRWRREGWFNTYSVFGKFDLDQSRIATNGLTFIQCTLGPLKP